MEQIFERPRIVEKVAVGLAILVGFGFWGVFTAAHWHTNSSWFTYVGLGGWAYVVSRLLYDKFVWKWPIVPESIRIPNFSGRWEGWYYSNVRKEWCATVHEMKQEAAFIKSANHWGQSTRANQTQSTRANQTKCMGAAILRTGSGPELHYSYQASPTSDAHPSARHEGLHILRKSEVEGCEFLIGEYMTNSQLAAGSPKGSTGDIIVMRAGKLLKGGLHFDETPWAIPRPAAECLPGGQTWDLLKRDAVKKAKGRKQGWWFRYRRMVIVIFALIAFALALGGLWFFAL